MTKTVSYIFPVSHHYRYPFHIALKEKLAAAGVEYIVVYSSPYGENIEKNDTVDIPWGVKVQSSVFLGGKLVLQWGLLQALRSDLIIVQQENRQLLNYACQLVAMLGLKKVAFFGHGRNFQSRRPNAFSQKWKRFWATKVTWWFGYTEETRRHITQLGFPENRVTVFNNSIDTKTMERQVAAISVDELDETRRAYHINTTNVGVYIGGLYSEKRLDFLVGAAQVIRRNVPDFELIVIGGGPDAIIVETAAAENPWIHYLGPKFGKEKAVLASLGKVFLMPGLVGLGVLDAFVYGTPLVTTAYPYHSPEIAYVADGVNGVIVDNPESVEDYASAVTKILIDESWRNSLVAGSRASLETYSVEEMARRFADGVLQALNA